MSGFHFVRVNSQGEVISSISTPFWMISDADWIEVDRSIDVGSAIVKVVDGEVRITEKGFKPSYAHEWDYETDTWVVNSAIKAAAQWERLKACRLQVRDSPITLDNGWVVDADQESIQTMEARVNAWGVGTNTMTEDGRQMWKGTENDYQYFTQPEFAAFVAEVRTKQALRYDAAFAFAEYMRSLLPLDDDNPAFDAANWPTGLE